MIQYNNSGSSACVLLYYISGMLFYEKTMCWESLQPTSCKNLHTSLGKKYKTSRDDLRIDLVEALASFKAESAWRKM